MPKKKDRRTYSRKSDMLLQQIFDNQRETREDVKTLINNQGEINGKIDSLTLQCDSRHAALKQDILNPKKSFKEIVVELFNSPKKIALWATMIISLFTAVSASVKADSAGAQVKYTEKLAVESISNITEQARIEKQADLARIRKLERMASTLTNAANVLEKFVEVVGGEQ